MSDTPIDRRDVQGILTQIQVDVATIKERSLAQGKTLEEVKEKIGGVIFREEYERRHSELAGIATEAKVEASTVRDDWLRRQGREQVWRIVFTAALALLGLIEAILHHP